MKRTLLFFVMLSVTYAGFSDERFPQQPDILSLLIASTQGEDGLQAPLANGNAAYYLRRAEYIGCCEAPFGRVHAAEFFFLRSSPRGSKMVPRGHTFVLFFDAALKLRVRWSLDMPLADLAFDHTKLLLGGKELFDFALPPAKGTVIVDGKPQSVPQWIQSK